MKPLLTFAIAALNQERFIREAVEAAFAQTYSPLEIILSDDNSEDRTFEIMKEMAAAYRGPHHLVLNQNPARRSIGGHVNRIVQISRGELIITAAGDDISLPDRALRTCEAWECSQRQATSVHSAIFQIDEDGRLMENIFKDQTVTASEKFVAQQTTPSAYVRSLEPMIYGCANAFSRALFERFGNLRDEIIHEDNALALRTVLAGKFLFINEPLVKYRVHDSNVFIGARRRHRDLNSLARQEDRFSRQLKNRQIMYEAFRPDLDKARQLGLIEFAEFQEAVAYCDRMVRRLTLMRQFLESNFVNKCRLIGTLKREGIGALEIRALRHRLLPRPLLLRLRLLKNYATPGSA